MSLGSTRNHTIPFFITSGSPPTLEATTCTSRAIAACALLYSLSKAARALIVTPASLKTEWEEQTRRSRADG
jgi:hypothetical protein